MHDKEKIVEGLEICTDTMNANLCYICPYKNLGGVCKLELMREGLAFIKNCEEEPK